MLTPIFNLSQDDDFIHLQIRAPHVSIKECEIQFEDRHFTFYAKPYFLRLYFPKQVIQDGREEATWDAEIGQFVIKVPKLVQGEVFEDLDMLTKLLTKPAKATPMIEVIDGEQHMHEDYDFDWTFDQTLKSEEDESVAITDHKYGFANSKSDFFEKLSDEISLAIDVRDPGKKGKIKRREERKIDESEHFDEDHYLASLYVDREDIDNLISFQAFWDSREAGELDNDEKFRLKNFPKKEYILDKTEKKSVLLGLIDILFAFAYDVRTTEGEHNSESNWTICKLSATLSWLESFDNLKETLVCCMRRSLCFPLYRDWKLSMKVLEDVQNILKCGKKTTLKCLLKVHELLNRTVDSRYILNDLYITDYCVWIQTVSEKSLIKLSECLKVSFNELTKEYLDLDIEIIEKAAIEVLREKMLTELSHDVDAIKLK